jgi:hypothetical protein
MNYQKKSKELNVLKYRLKRTDYSNHKIKLTNTTYHDDMYRALNITIELPKCYNYDAVMGYY